MNRLDLNAKNPCMVDVKGTVNRSPAVWYVWKSDEGWPVVFVTENMTMFVKPFKAPKDLPGSHPAG